MVEEKKEEVPQEKTTKEKEQVEKPEPEKEKPSPEIKKEEKSTENKKEKKEKKIEVPKKFKKLVEEIEGLSVLDLAELVKVLEKKFGVSAQAPVVMTTAPGAEASAPAEEKSVFNIELKELGDKKIEVIKAVRDISQKGLKEAKDLVDAVVSGPQVIKENVKKDEAEEIKKKLEAAGAKVELK